MKRKSILGVAAVFVAVFIMSVSAVISQLGEEKRSADSFESVRKLLSEAVTDTNTTDTTDMNEGEYDTSDVSNETGTGKSPQSTVSAYDRYRAVYEKNREFVGWITIDGTLIDYPVMQSRNIGDFYLDHDFYGNKSDYGVPFVQQNCVLGKSDNIIIYGHHKKNGTMFTDLCKYEDEDFYREHKTIKFDTLDGYGVYEIVTVFKTVAYSEDGFRYYDLVSAGSKEAFDEYIAECRSLELYDTGVDAEYGDSLLTLSTCEYSRKNGRMVIVAKRIGGDEV